MANTYTALHYHIVFSTKQRERWLRGDIEDRVWAFIGGVAHKNKMTALQVGGIDDHVHVLIGAPPSIAPSKIAQLIKGGSSKWIHDAIPQMHAFAWQDGFGAFSVSKSSVLGVSKYIRDQRLHHRHRTFQEEFLLLLQVHGIDYDERYLWT
jgi:REP element-mobilizing transposase RayT